MPGKFCARSTCCERATALLLINARELSAQIVDIREGEDAGMVGVPLCRDHADGTVVPLGWTLADLRSPAETSAFEPELVLVDAAVSEPAEALGLPEMEETASKDVVSEDLGSEEAASEEMEDMAVGEVPPLLSRAFRAAGLD